MPLFNRILNSTTTPMARNAALTWSLFAPRVPVSISRYFPTFGRTFSSSRRRSDSMNDNFQTDTRANRPGSTSMSDTARSTRDIPVQGGTTGKDQAMHHVDESKRHDTKTHPMTHSMTHQNQNQDQMGNQNQMMSNRMMDVTNPSSWVSDFFQHPFGHMNQLMSAPRQQISVDVIHNPTEVIVRAECPGIRKEDVKVNLDGDMLTISGERKSENYEKSANFVRRECSYGSMSRSIRLPQDAELDKVSAKYQDGVLNVTLPRKPSNDNDTHQVKNVPIQ